MNDMSSFIELVKTMREAQKTYFRERTQSALQRSKNLERQVDVQIEKLSKPKEQAQQAVMTFVTAEKNATGVPIK